MTIACRWSSRSTAGIAAKVDGSSGDSRLRAPGGSELPTGSCCVALPSVRYSDPVLPREGQSNCSYHSGISCRSSANCEGCCCNLMVALCRSPRSPRRPHHQHQGTRAVCRTRSHECTRESGPGLHSWGRTQHQMDQRRRS